MKNKISGFSLVELLVAVSIIAILSVVSYSAYGSISDWLTNGKTENDLLAISNSLEQYKRDHYGKYPIPSAGSNQNVLCYNSAANYVHDCASAAFVQGMIDNDLLTKRYLSDVPLDPRTGSRYAYGVTTDGKYFMVAGLYKNGDGTYSARTVENLGKGYRLPSLIRSYDGSDFVLDEGIYLPYNPNILEVTATLDNINGEVRTGPAGDCTTLPPANAGATVYAGHKICTDENSNVEIYFSDGSLSYLDENTEIELPDLSYVRNDGTATISKILIQLKKGKIWSKVVRLASASEFRIQTTNQIVGVRGTEFGVLYEEAGNLSTTTVKTGQVDITPTGGTATLVEPQADGTPSTITVGGDGAAVPGANHLTEPVWTSSSELSIFYTPYLVGFTPYVSQPYEIEVTFNGTAIVSGSANAPEPVTGFEISLKEDADPALEVAGADLSFDADHFSPGLGAYLLKLDYMNDLPANSTVILRGYVTTPEGKRYSKFSMQYGLTPATAENEGRHVDFKREFAGYFPSTTENVVTAPSCGNGILNVGETCEPSLNPSPTCPAGTAGTAVCNATTCQFDYSACLTAQQTCENAEKIWKSEGGLNGTCLLVAQAACYGTDLVADGVAGVTADDKGYWDGSACWVLGAAGASCTSACTTASASLACDTGTLWNDDAGYTVCGQLNPTATVKTILTLTDATFNPIAPFRLSGTACRARNSGYSITNSQLCTNTNASYQRFCKCQ